MINVVLWILLVVFYLAVSFVPGLAPGAEAQNNGVLMGQIILGAIWVGFLGYSLYCSYRESLVKTVRRMFAWHWGRQIGLDLYLGLLMFCGMIFLVEGSLWIALIWLVPTLIYGNLVPLFYAATRLPMIVSGFAFAG
jgi:hypothetical protein